MNDRNKIYNLALAGVQQLIPYKAGKPIEELERELGLTQVIKLASNENPLGPGKKTLAAIQAALPSLALYPDGSGFALKQALAEIHKEYRYILTLIRNDNSPALRLSLAAGFQIIGVRQATNKQLFVELLQEA